MSRGKPTKTERINMVVSPHVLQWLKDNGGISKVIDKLIQEAMKR